MLARADASLDLLDLLPGGRFVLALGSGALWEGIAAMGGPRRTPGQAATALDEAATVVRELWDTERRTGARFEGDFCTLSGAERGPTPAHRIPVRLGAYKPRGPAHRRRRGRSSAATRPRSAAC